MANPRVFLTAMATATPLLAATAARADDPPRVCTQIACESGVFFDLADAKRDVPGTVAATVCVDRRCRRVRRLSNAIRVKPSSLSGSPVRVRAVLYDRRGKRLLRVARSVKVKRTQPNGPDCPPICFSRRLRLETDPGRLVATD
jgi:hypothetical protein